MDLHGLEVFRAVAGEKSFSRAARRLGRTQPAISLAVQRLEAELGERLIDRLGKDLRLTDAGTLVLDFARRFENLRQELVTAIAERRDNAAGRLTIGANESTTLYLLPHLARYRRRYPRVRVQVRRSLSSRIPSELIDGDLELGVISYQPQDDRLTTRVIYSDHLAFVVSPQHRLARRKSVEGEGLHVAAEADHLVGGVAVVHAHDFLLDDRAGVEVGGGVVAGGADELHAAVEGLVVGLGPHEGGQEAVVDVDNLAVQPLAHGGRDDLHEAREHHGLAADLRV
jgi:DNA-binding transcriptional LysR family regulator